MLTQYDYTILGFYFAFMFLIGWVTKALSKDSSDYLRGGGAMVWWLVGASAFMQQFSAWTFTAGAGKAYQDGWIIAVIYVANAVGYFFNYLWFGARFRQMRLVTAIEAVRERFSPFNEQFFTWVGLPIGLIGSALQLYGLAVFFSAAFDFDITATILLVGFVVVFMTVAGGSWAVVAGDFIQAVLLMVISTITALMALGHGGVGGIAGFIEKAPSRYFHWTENVQGEMVVLWIISMFINQFVRMNHLIDASRYLCVKDGSHARKAALLACVLMLVGPIFWFIPPMVAGILEPNIGLHFPGLKTPSEGAYVFTGLLVLPVGMTGLMLCGIFAATMASMDAGLNRTAGILVKNFYQPIINPKASEAILLRTSRWVTLGLGVVIILCTEYMSRLRGLSLFDMMFLFGAMVALPYALPLVWCMLIKRTPPWSGWSTVVVGLLSTYFINRYLNREWLCAQLGISTPLTAREKNDFEVIVDVISNTGICTLWFFGTMLFYRGSSSTYKTRVQGFFVRMNTPVDSGQEKAVASDDKQARMLGKLTLAYGSFIAVAALCVPQSSLEKRAIFFSSGAVMGLIGLILLRSARRTGVYPA